MRSIDAAWSSHTNKTYELMQNETHCLAMLKGKIISCQNRWEEALNDRLAGPHKDPLVSSRRIYPPFFPGGYEKLCLWRNIATNGKYVKTTAQWKEKNGKPKTGPLKSTGWCVFGRLHKSRLSRDNKTFVLHKIFTHKSQINTIQVFSWGLYVWKYF